MPNKLLQSTLNDVIESIKPAKQLVLGERATSDLRAILKTCLDLVVTLEELSGTPLHIPDDALTCAIADGIASGTIVLHPAFHRAQRQS